VVKSITGEYHMFKKIWDDIRSGWGWVKFAIECLKK